jgi:tRNA (guanine-N7-)-methyltransferase
MGKNKHLRFAENETFALLHQPPFQDIFKNDFWLKGQWRQTFFKNENPVALELGCGRGEYTVELARRYPAKNFIGIDIKGARLWRGAKTATEEALPNVAFIRTRIDCLTAFFARREVDEIWLTFPDPQPKYARRRLTSPPFLARYAQVLKPHGIIHLKTDSLALHQYTLAMAKQHNLPLLAVGRKSNGQWSMSNGEWSMVNGQWATSALGRQPVLHSPLTIDHSPLDIQTFYERRYVRQGLPIYYCAFTLGGKTAFEE